MNGAYENSAGAGAIAKQSPVASAMSQNTNIVSRLHNQVDSLVAQLGPVISMPQPTSDTQEKRSQGHSILHEELLSHGDSLSSVSARLEDILSRITI